MAGSARRRRDTRRPETSAGRVASLTQCQTCHRDDTAAVLGHSRPLRPAGLPALRPQRAAAAGGLARPVAQLRRRQAVRHPAGDPAPGLRPRRHPLRPGQQLRPALRRRRDQLRRAPARRTSGPTGTSWSSRPRPATTCGPGRTASGGRASTCSPASTSRWPGWAWTTSTSSTATGSTPSTPLEETMGALDTAVRQGKALYAGISSYSAGAHSSRRPRSCATSGHRCSSTSRRTRCSTAGSRRRSCSTRWATGRRLHRVLPAGAGHAHRPLPRRHPRGLAGSAGQVARPGRAHRAPASSQYGRSTRSRAAAGQSLAQLALAWALRDPRVTSVLVGASSVDQLDDNLAAARHRSTSPTTSWPRSTSTRSTPASTCGRASADCGTAAASTEAPGSPRVCPPTAISAVRG